MLAVVCRGMLGDQCPIFFWVRLMCGIACFVKKDDNDVAGLRVFWALKRLEQRGYDGFGLAGMTGDKVLRHVQLGRPSQADLPPDELLSSQVVIGHNRWATHGQPTKQNCHPVEGGRQLTPIHRKVWVVHNGILTNHTQLKQRLEAGGWTHSTETDTETLAHLISFHLYENWRDPVKTLRDVSREAEGDMAFVAMSPSTADHGVLMFGCARGAPLCVTPDGGIVSDPSCLPPNTRYRRLNYGEAVLVLSDDRPHRVVVVDLESGSSQVPEFTALSPAHDDQVWKSGFMLSEIEEQPNVLVREVKDDLLNFGSPPAIVLVGCGSSYNAALLASYRVREYARVPVKVLFPHELSGNQEHLLGLPAGTRLLAVTQSGETRDVLSVLREYEAARPWVLTNAPDSTAAAACPGRTLLMGAGVERAVAATKTYTATVAKLARLASHLSYLPIRGLVDEAFGVKLAAELAAVVGSSRAQDIARMVNRAHHVFLLGNGADYAVAREAALKLKEVAYVHAEAVHASELKHGPLALVDQNCLSIFVNSSGGDQYDTAASEVYARQGIVVGVGHTPDESGYHEVVRVGSSVQAISPLVVNAFLQLVAYHSATLNRLDPDFPRNLSKTVTV